MPTSSETSEQVAYCPACRGITMGMQASGLLVRDVAFVPNDEQITAFLAARQAPTRPRPDWLGPAAAPAFQMPAVEQADAVGDDQTAQIRALHAAGKSLNAIQDDVFGYRGGSAYAAVKAALR